MNKKVYTERSRGGFTLIELLVVIAIIGILAAIIMVSLSSARQKAYDASDISNVRSLMSAIELYKNDNADTPPTPANLTAALVPTYVSKLPAGIDATTYFNGGTNGYCLITPNAMRSGNVGVKGFYFYAKDGTTGYTTGAGKPGAYLDCK